MVLFLKTIAITMISLIVWMLLSKQSKEISLSLSIIVCCIILIAAMTYVKPVLDFLARLENLGQLDSEMISILLNAVGIILLSELVALLCKDSGNAALGNSVQLLGTAVILWLSLPMLNSVLDTIEEILTAL